MTVIAEQYVVLSHELLHSKDIWNGALDRSLSKEIAITFDWGQEWVDANTHEVRRTPGFEPKKNSEVNAIKGENKIREEHGLVLRILGVSTKDVTNVLPETE